MDLDPELLDRLIDVGNAALNDYYHERACSCSSWPESCVTEGIYSGSYDTNAFAISLSAIITTYEQIRRPR